MGKIMFNGVDYSAPTTSAVTGVKGNAETAYKTGNVNITPANIGALSTNGDASNTTNTFSTASSRTNLTTKEKLSVSLGKITKWFTDLKSIAFSGKASDVTCDDNSTLQTKVGAINGITDDLASTSSNVALSAKAGNSLQSQVTTLNSNFNNYQPKGNYIAAISHSIGLDWNNSNVQAVVDGTTVGNLAFVSSLQFKQYTGQWYGLYGSPDFTSTVYYNDIIKVASVYGYFTLNSASYGQQIQFAQHWIYRPINSVSIPVVCQNNNHTAGIVTIHANGNVIFDSIVTYDSAVAFSYNGMYLYQ